MKLHSWVLMQIWIELTKLNRHKALATSIGIFNRLIGQNKSRFKYGPVVNIELTGSLTWCGQTEAETCLNVYLCMWFPNLLPPPPKGLQLSSGSWIREDGMLMAFPSCLQMILDLLHLLQQLGGLCFLLVFSLASHFTSWQLDWLSSKYCFLATAILCLSGIFSLQFLC